MVFGWDGRQNHDVRTVLANNTELVILIVRRTSSILGGDDTFVKNHGSPNNNMLSKIYMDVVLRSGMDAEISLGGFKLGNFSSSMVAIFEKEGSGSSASHEL